jgi:hypothetical protein
MRRLYATLLALTLTPSLAACSEDEGEGLPNAPTQLRATLEVTSGVSLTWRDVSDEEDKYVVERKQAESNGDFAVIAELPADTVAYTDSEIMAATSYRYRVLAVNGFGESASDEVLIMVP